MRILNIPKELPIKYTVVQVPIETSVGTLRSFLGSTTQIEFGDECWHMVGVNGECIEVNTGEVAIVRP